MRKRLLEDLSDAGQVCILLRAEGQTYQEIAAFLGVSERRIRHELEQASDAFPGLLDHGRETNTGRSIRLCYLLGLNDAGAELSELPDYLDCLESRSAWLKTRIARDVSPRYRRESA